MTESQPVAPIVDPSPTAAPIALNNQSLQELMTAHPAAASPDEVLALEPNRYEDATSGPDEQISQTAYVEMTKPDGTTFLSPKANVPYYEWKGYTAGAEQDIPDFVGYLEDQAKKSAEGGGAAETPPPETASP